MSNYPQNEDMNRFAREDTNDTSVTLSPKVEEVPLRVEFPSTHVDSRETVFHGLSKEIRSLPGNTFLDRYQKERELTGKSAVFDLDYDIYENRRPEGILDIPRYIRDVLNSQSDWNADNWSRLGRQHMQHVHNPHVDIYRADPLSSLSITFRASVIMFIMFSILWMTNPADGFEAVGTFYTMFARKMLGTFAVLQSWAMRHAHFFNESLSVENYHFLHLLVNSTFLDLVESPVSALGVLGHSQPYSIVYKLYQDFALGKTVRDNYSYIRTMYIHSPDEDIYKSTSRFKNRKRIPLNRLMFVDSFRKGFSTKHALARRWGIRLNSLKRRIYFRFSESFDMFWTAKQHRFPKIYHFYMRCVNYRRRMYTRKLKFFVKSFHEVIGTKYNGQLNLGFERYVFLRFNTGGASRWWAAQAYVTRRFIYEDRMWGIRRSIYDFDTVEEEDRYLSPSDMDTAQRHYFGNTTNEDYPDHVEYAVSHMSLYRLLLSLFKYEALPSVLPLNDLMHGSAADNVGKVFGLVARAQFVWLIPVVLITVHAVHGIAHMFMDQAIGTDDVRTRASVWSNLERMLMLLVLGIL